jgi:hypothetical protein
MNAPSHISTSTAAGGLRVSVVSGDGAYDMFDVVSVDRGGVKVRGPILLEISEEVPLRLTRNGAVVELRARVAGHEHDAGAAVTELVFLDGEREVGRLLGA